MRASQSPNRMLLSSQPSRSSTGGTPFLSPSHELMPEACMVLGIPEEQQLEAMAPSGALQTQPQWHRPLPLGGGRVARPGSQCPGTALRQDPSPTCSPPTGASAGHMAPAEASDWSAMTSPYFKAHLQVGGGVSRIWVMQTESDRKEDNSCSRHACHLPTCPLFNTRVAE